MKGKTTKNKISYSVYFLALVISIYIILFFLKPDGIQKSLWVSGNLLIHIIPILLVVIFFMGIMDYFINLNPKAVSKYVGKRSGIKGWILAILMGILSHGPIYVWYPLLKELREHGMRSGLIAAFIYNRSIKIPLLPLMIYYFGTIYVALLSIFIVIGSIISGKIIELIDISFY